MGGVCGWGQGQRREQEGATSRRREKRKQKFQFGLSDSIWKGSLETILEGGEEEKQIGAPPHHLISNFLFCKASRKN